MIDNIEKNDQLPSALTWASFVAVFFLAISIGVIAYLVGNELNKQDVQEYDVSAIAEELHCDDGTVRVVSAKVYERQGNIITLEDSTGELWCVEDVTVEDNDCILLWIADNHTEDDVTDDVVIKVYTEAHS